MHTKGVRATHLFLEKGRAFARAVSPGVPTNANTARTLPQTHRSNGTQGAMIRPVRKRQPYHKTCLLSALRLAALGVSTLSRVSIFLMRSFASSETVLQY